MLQFSKDFLNSLKKKKKRFFQYFTNKLRTKICLNQLNLKKIWSP